MLTKTLSFSEYRTLPSPYASVSLQDASLMKLISTESAARDSLSEVVSPKEIFLLKFVLVWCLVTVMQTRLKQHPRTVGQFHVSLSVTYVVF